MFIFEGFEFDVELMERTGRVLHFLADSEEEAIQSCLYTAKLMNGNASIGPSGRAVYCGPNVAIVFTKKSFIGKTDNMAILMNKTYPIVDRPTKEELKGVPMNQIRAVWTGEKRMPKKGEWFLSGAIIEAYRAPSDLTTKFHIAKLVRVKTHTVERYFEL